MAAASRFTRSLLWLAMLAAAAAPALSQALTSTPAPESHAKFRPRPHQQAAKQELPRQNVQQAEQLPATTDAESQQQAKYHHALVSVEASLDESLTRHVSRSKQHAAKLGLHAKPAPKRSSRKLIDSLVVPLLRGQRITRTKGAVFVGTPFQGPWSVTYDTGSADTWVVGFRSPNYEANATAPFQPSRSSTYKSYGFKVTDRYGSEADTLQVSRDTIGLPYYQNNSLVTLSVTSYDFGVATAQVQNASGPSYGIVGFAWPSLNQLDTVNVQPLPYAVAKGLKLGGFSFWYNTSAKANADPKSLLTGAGYVAFGPPQSEFYTGSLLTLNIDNSNGFWATTLMSGGTKGQVKVEGPWDVIFDTGTEFNMLPNAIVESYYDSLDAVKAGFRVSGGAGSGDLYCLKASALKTAPVLELAVTDGDNAISFTTPASNLVTSSDPVKLKNGTQCYLMGLLGSDDSIYILGQVWLRNYYTIWSYDDVTMQFGARAIL